MVRDQPAKLGLYGTMGPAGGRHRLRLSVHELPRAAIPRVPNEKFRDGHPDRYLGNRTHDSRLAQKDGRPNQPAAGLWQDTLVCQTSVQPPAAPERPARRVVL